MLGLNDVIAYAPSHFEWLKFYPRVRNFPFHMKMNRATN